MEKRWFIFTFSPDAARRQLVGRTMKKGLHPRMPLPKYTPRLYGCRKQGLFLDAWGAKKQDALSSGPDLPLRPLASQSRRASGGGSAFGEFLHEVGDVPFAAATARERAGPSGDGLQVHALLGQALDVPSFRAAAMAHDFLRLAGWILFHPGQPFVLTRNTVTSSRSWYSCLARIR